MIRPNKSSQASLSADENPGRKAKALGPCGVALSREGAQARALALSAINLARGHLGHCAQATDTPEASLVDAADWLDLAADCLALAEFSDAIKDAPDGDE